MRRRLLVPAAVAVLLLAAGLAWWLTRAPEVPVVTVREAPLVRTLQFSGRVATASRVDVGATLTGRVAAVRVDAGEAVRRGDVLLTLETDELDAAVAQAVAAEQQAQARIAGITGPARRGATAGVAQAASVLTAAQAEARRTEELVATGFLGPARLDDTRRAVAVAQAQLEAARAQAEAVGDGGTDLTQARAQLATARAARRAAEARLAQAAVVAPADGRVLARQAEPGQIVQPGRALLTLALAGPTRLVAPVDERFLGQLAVGQGAMVVADAFEDRPFAARVSAIAPLVDAQRGAVEVELDLAGPAPAFLREDMTLSIEVETARRAKALVVPLSALDESGGTPRVQVVRDGRVADQPVATGLRTLAAVEVREGLAAGAQVVAGPRREPGARARPVEQAPAPRPGGGPAPTPAGEREAGAMSRAMAR